MELTKKDAKQIDEEVRKLMWRIKVEASEYAKLYEKTYYERLAEECMREVCIIGEVQERSIEAANK